jgi:hypothetical protein
MSPDRSRKTSDPLIRGTLMSNPTVEAPSDKLQRLEQDTERLAARLKQVNRQISFLQLALLFGAASLIGGGYYLITTGKLQVEGLSSAVANRVETKDFGFYNQKDTRVIFFDDDKFGMPQIIFLDAKKRLRMRLKVFPDGDGSGGLAFYDSTGWRGLLRLDGEETSVLNLVGKGQKGGIAMAVAPDGTPSLKMTDKDGKVLWQAPAKSN